MSERIEASADRFRPRYELAPNDVVVLDCLSSEGEACQTTLTVDEFTEWDQTIVTVSGDTSRSPLVPGEQYELFYPPRQPGSEDESMVRGAYQWLLPAHGLVREPVRTSRVVGATVMRDDPNGPMVFNPFLK